MAVGELPEGALVTGKEDDGTPLYSTKSESFGVGYYSSHHKTAHFVVEGKEKQVTDGEVEVLCIEK